jgi:hypothetical protein
VLIQLQMLIKYASVIPKRSSLILALSRPPRLSGSHNNSKSNLKLNLREQVLIQKKLTKLARKKKAMLKKPPLLLKLKMRKPLQTSKVLKLVLFNQLKNHTNSEKPRSPKEELHSKRPFPREDPK